LTEVSSHRHGGTHPAGTERGDDRQVGGFLPSLTGLRFYAALLVVAYHLTLYVGKLPILSDVARFGRTGVTFFFVLSGFVLTWSYFNKPTVYRTYYWRRVARIYPMHLLALVITSAIYLTIASDRVPPLTWHTFWPSALLIHAWFPQPAVNAGGNGAAWSLCDEMFFYLIFPLLLLAFAAVRRRWALLMIPALMTIVSLVLWIVIPLEGIGPYLRVLLLDYFPLSRVVQFAGGIALAVAMRRGWRAPWSVRVAVGIVVGYHLLLVPWANATGIASRWYPYSASQLFALLPFGTLIAAVATRDLQGAGTHLSSRPMVLLGQASYSWYLLHVAVIYTFLWIFPPAGTRWGVAVTWMVLLVVSQGIAILAYLRFEHPVENRLRRMTVGWHGRRFLAT
jgi:peptidoglycan/LPS O-acetylase OafA/YrhL